MKTNKKVKIKLEKWQKKYSQERGTHRVRIAKKRQMRNGGCESLLHGN